MKAWFRFWRHMFDFKGRCTRGEYFGAIIMHGFLYFVFMLICGIAGVSHPFWKTVFIQLNESSVVSFAYAILLLIALTAATVRRLNDGGYSWRSYGWLLIPFLGYIAFMGRIFEKSVEELPNKPKI